MLLNLLLSAIIFNYNLIKGSSNSVELLDSKFFAFKSESNDVNFDFVTVNDKNDAVIILENIKDPLEIHSRNYILKKVDLLDHQPETSTPECKIAIQEHVATHQVYCPIPLGTHKAILPMKQLDKLKLQILDLENCVTITQITLNDTSPALPSFVNDVLPSVLIFEQTFEVFHQVNGTTFKTEYDHSGRSVSQNTIKLQTSSIYTCVCRRPGDCSHCQTRKVNFFQQLNFAPVNPKSSAKGYYFLLTLDGADLIEHVSQEGRILRKVLEYTSSPERSKYDYGMTEIKIISNAHDQLTVCSIEDLRCRRFSHELRLDFETSQRDLFYNDEGAIDYNRALDIVNVHNLVDGLVVLSWGCDVNRSFMQLLKFDNKGKLISRSKDVNLPVDKCTGTDTRDLKTRIIEKSDGNDLEVWTGYVGNDPKNNSVEGLVVHKYKITLDKMSLK